MAQLRQDYSAFLDKDSDIVVIGPDGASKFKNYWRKHNLPFIGLPDPQHKTLKLYGQQIKLFKFGRMPAQVMIDKNGIARYAHYGKSMSDIPTNEELLKLLDEFNLEFNVQD